MLVTSRCLTRSLQSCFGPMVFFTTSESSFEKTFKVSTAVPLQLAFDCSDLLDFAVAMPLATDMSLGRPGMPRFAGEVVEPAAAVPEPAEPALAVSAPAATAPEPPREWRHRSRGRVCPDGV